MPVFKSEPGPGPSLTAVEIAKKLEPLDRDGMQIMMDPPERFPAFLVLRLCEPKRLVGEKRHHGPRPHKGDRPALVTRRGDVFELNKLGREVAAVLSTLP
jgi:hypothetical protein